MATVSDKVRSEYRSILEQLRQEKSHEQAGNRYPWQCQVAVQELFEEAILRQGRARKEGGKTVVRIFSGTCPDYVYGAKVTMNLVEQFLAVGGKIRALIWNATFDAAEHRIGRLANANSAGVEVLVSGTSRRGETLRHFVVVDDYAYRLESPHPIDTHCEDAFNDFSPEIPARICFNDSQQGKQLVEFFDLLWSNVSDAQAATA